MTYIFKINKKNLELSEIISAIMENIFNGLKNEFEIAMVNEPSNFSVLFFQVKLIQGGEPTSRRRANKG